MRTPPEESEHRASAAGICEWWLVPVRVPPKRSRMLFETESVWLSSKAAIRLYPSPQAPVVIGRAQVLLAAEEQVNSLRHCCESREKPSPSKHVVEVSRRAVSIELFDVSFSCIHVCFALEIVWFDSTRVECIFNRHCIGHNFEVSVTALWWFP